MRYDQKQFTQQGLNLFTNALSQKQSITIDKVIMDNLPTSNLSNLALLTLDDFANAQSFPANYTKVDNNMLTVDSVISNQGLTNSYSANEVGLVGHTESNNDETLIAILVASDPFVLPAQQQGETPLHLIPNVTIQLANNDMQQVPVDTAQDAYIPQQDLDSLVAQHGYIKLSDADDRYVKQQDFQNEVNNSVNKKADQSDVNQKFNQAESDVQTKANQSDLNTTNNNVSNNTNAIPQALNQATAHSDQNYSNLSNKSDSLSQKVEDYQKPNLVSGSNQIQTINGHYGSDSYISDIASVYLEEGKKYWISFYGSSDGYQSFFTYFNINPNPNTDIWKKYNANLISLYPPTNDKLFIASYVPPNTQTYYISNAKWSNLSVVQYSCLTVTQSDNYIPFEIAQSNREKYLNNGQFTKDYQAPNLVDSNEEYTQIDESSFYGDIAKVNLVEGRKYYFSVETECTQNYIGILMGISQSPNSDLVGNGTAWTGVQNNNYISDTHFTFNFSFVAPNTQEYYIARYIGSHGPNLHAYYRKLTLTQSDNYVPFEIAQQNRYRYDYLIDYMNSGNHS